MFCNNRQLVLNVLAVGDSASHNLIIRAQIFGCIYAHMPTIENRGWGLAISAVCECKQQQIINHIVNMCPLTPFEG